MCHFLDDTIYYLFSYLWKNSNHVFVTGYYMYMGLEKLSNLLDQTLTLRD